MELPPIRPRSRTQAPPQEIEPRRLRRIIRGGEPVDGRLDLHGEDQARARAMLEGFILAAHARDARAVLVITGKGMRGEGVLRQRTPEWLAQPPLRNVVAGLSMASAKDGGAGALYVALRPRAPRRRPG